MLIDKQKPLVIAHRGESEFAPENTIQACHLALKQGATALEVDVRLCGSGEIILYHDNFLHRHFGISKPVLYTSLSEIKALRFSRKPYRYPGEVCSLSEFLEEFKNTVPLNLDAKTMFTNNRHFARMLIHTVMRHNIAGQVWISSFNPLFLHLLKKMEPDLRIGYLFRNMAYVHRFIDVLMQSEAWHPHHSVITERFLELARRLQKEVYVWTVNEQAIWDTFRDYGFEGIITDKLFRKQLSGI